MPAAPVHATPGWLGALAALLLAGCATPPEPQGPDRCVARADGSRCVTQPPRRLNLLGPGAPVTVRVDARCEWNPTGVILERGARYQLTVKNVIEPWADSRQAASDLRSGWPGLWGRGGRVVQRWSRSPEHPMYALIAAQGREARTFFVVGPQQEFIAASGEELLFFANDWPGRYHNNHGCVEVEIQRQ